MFLFVLILIIIILLCISLFAVYYQPLQENYEYTTIYYCNDCKGKTFGQCTQCASCLWVNGYDYGKKQFFAECRKGDDHGLWENNTPKRPALWKYSRDPFYNHPYYPMFD